GARTLFPTTPEPLVGEDVRALQERLLEMGYDVGRADAIYGPRTARAVAQFQREVGLSPDGAFGPQTLQALRRLGRKVVGGRPQWLRESERLRWAGPTLIGKRVVIDPGHGGPDLGVVVVDGQLRWTEAELVWDLASRLEGRLTAAGVRAHLTRGPRLATRMPDQARDELSGQPRGRRGRLLPLRHPQRGHLHDRGTSGRAGAAGNRGADRDAGLSHPRQDLGSAAPDPHAGGPGGRGLPHLPRGPGTPDRSPVPGPVGGRDPGRGAADVLPDGGGRADRLHRRQHPASPPGGGGALTRAVGSNAGPRSGDDPHAVNHRFTAASSSVRQDTAVRSSNRSRG